MKKQIYLTLILGTYAHTALAEGMELSPFGMQEHTTSIHTESMEPGNNSPFGMQEHTNPFFNDEEKAPMPEQELHEALPFMHHEEEHHEPFGLEHEHHEQLPATSKEEKPTEHLSTATINADLTTIHMTPGHAHVFAPLQYEGTQEIGYFIQQEPYKKYLTSTEKKEGTKTSLTYTLSLPHDAPAGTCTIFKGKGNATNPTELQPAFHIEIKEAPAQPKIALTPEQKKEALKQAWDKQQAAEEKYAATLKNAFEQLRKEIREIWYTVSEQNDNFEGDTTLITASKTETKEPLHLYIGQTETITTGKGGSIQSSEPQTVSVKLTFTDKEKMSPWEFSVTGLAAGKSVITYCVGAVSYEQPVIVEKKIEEPTPEADEATTHQEEHNAEKMPALINPIHQAEEHEHADHVTDNTEHTAQKQEVLPTEKADIVAPAPMDELEKEHAAVLAGVHENHDFHDEDMMDDDEDEDHDDDDFDDFDDFENDDENHDLEMHEEDHVV